MIDYSQLPALNATLNGVSTIFLTVGYVFIRRGEMRRHRACKIAALVSSALFLNTYKVNHPQ